jgi:hypothetical protein
MNKFLNLPENAVEEMLQGLAVLSPGVMRLPGPQGYGSCGCGTGPRKTGSSNFGRGAVDMSQRMQATSCLAPACSEKSSRHLASTPLLHRSRRSRENAEPCPSMNFMVIYAIYKTTSPGVVVFPIVPESRLKAKKPSSLFSYISALKSSIRSDTARCSSGFRS